MNLLVVDDDDDIRTMLSDLLTLEGFDVDMAENGKVALKALTKKNYDLILLDIMMPVMNGIDALKAIRAEYDVPVLMLTARGNESDRVEGLELGADDYLPKPFNDRELLARIKAILRRMGKKADATEDAIVNFEGLVLNKQTKQVLHQGNSLNLTIAEFSCLELLINNLNNVVSKESLSLQVLGKELSPYDRSIDMHMSNLRKKLPEREDGKNWFSTLRGRGYTMNFDNVEMENN